MTGFAHGQKRKAFLVQLGVCHHRIYDDVLLIMRTFRFIPFLFGHMQTYILAVELGSETLFSNTTSGC